MLTRLVSLSVFLPALAAGAQRPSLDSLDQYVHGAMRAWRVPGVAIAIVRDSSELLRGYGVRQIGRPERVDEHTVFAIGSATKAFTAAAIGMLVDEKRLAWDDRVVARLPEFRLADAGATGEVTLRDLLAHRASLGRADMVWYGTRLSREEVVRRLRFVPPVGPLRSQFAYSNLGYVALGEVIGAATGEPWEVVVRRRILEPLGMRETGTSVRDLAHASNLARPHALVGDSARVIAYRDVDNAAPAIAINSSAADMARWLAFQLDGARAGTATLLSRATFAELRRPQILVPLAPAARRRNPHRHLRAYAMGWYVEDYRGREILWHTGTTDGMSAIVAVVPEERLGIAVLANVHGSPLPEALMYRIVDAHLGAPATDWSALLLEDRARAIARGRAFESREDSARARDSRPSLPLSAYAGTYADSLFGEVRVTVADGILTISSDGDLRGTLEHWENDTFVLHSESPLQEGRIHATFTLDDAHRPARLTLDLDEAATFDRVDRDPPPQRLPPYAPTAVPPS